MKAKFKKKIIISQKLAKAEFQDIKNSDFIGDSDSNDDSEYNASYFNDDGLLSKSTVSSVIGHDIPMSRFFTRELDKVSNVNLEDNIFDQLYQQKSKRWFKRGTWPSYFVKGLKKSNPFCVFKFKHHHVSKADKYQLNRNQRLFATGGCIFSNCEVQVK